LKSLTNKQVAALLLQFDKNPAIFEGNALGTLLMERKDMADKERLYVSEMIMLQEKINTELGKKAQELTMLRGQVVYVENKILEELEKSKLDEKQ